jgi:hypothetical protein
MMNRGFSPDVSMALLRLVAVKDAEIVRLRSELHQLQARCAVYEAAIDATHAAGGEIEFPRPFPRPVLSQLLPQAGAAVARTGARARELSDNEAAVQDATRD